MYLTLAVVYPYPCSSSFLFSSREENMTCFSGRKEWQSSPPCHSPPLFAQDHSSLLTSNHATTTCSLSSSYPRFSTEVQAAIPHKGHVYFQLITAVLFYGYRTTLCLSGTNLVLFFSLKSITEVKATTQNKGVIQAEQFTDV